MSDPNFAEQAGAFAADAGIDTAVDGVLNNVIDAVTSHIPGGEAIDGMLKTGIDLNVNNAINAEGILGDIGGLFGHNSQA
jgi:uncharacterized membrane protein